MSFDRVFQLGSGLSACTYDIDAQDVHDEAGARRLTSTIRKRVQEGRAQRPDAAHYVTVLGGHLLDEGVRDVLLAGMSQDEGIDSIAFEAGTLNDVPSAWTSAAEAGAVSDLPPAWVAIAEATEMDAPLNGRVIAAGVDGIRVDVGGAIGALRVNGRAVPVLGEHVKVRVIVLNLARRHLELILAT